MKLNFFLFQHIGSIMKQIPGFSAVRAEVNSSRGSWFSRPDTLTFTLTPARYLLLQRLAVGPSAHAATLKSVVRKERSRS